VEKNRALKLAWAAGLYEGEGSLSVWVRKDGVTVPKMQMRSTDEDVVRRFATIMGRGAVTGPHFDGNPKHRPIWRWQLSSWPYVEAVTDSFWPYLGRRRRGQIDQVFARAPERNRFGWEPHPR
jgi:hypothetical protein